MATADADDVIRRFCATWESNDVDALMVFFADGATYHIVPMPPAVGLDAIRSFLTDFLALAESVRFETVNQLSSGSLVMNERIGHLVIDGASIRLPLAGVFEVDDDGRITRVSDYFDLGQFAGA